MNEWIIALDWLLGILIANIGFWCILVRIFQKNIIMETEKRIERFGG